MQRQQLAIDFVVHGDEGIAAPWAAHAEPGDILTLSGTSGVYYPDPGCDWHLLAGDESALPAICSALEALPGDARGIAYLETCDPGEYLDATPPSGVEVIWLHRPQPEGLRRDLGCDGAQPPVAVVGVVEQHLDVAWPGQVAGPHQVLAVVQVPQPRGVGYPREIIGQGPRRAASRALPSGERARRAAAVSPRRANIIRPRQMV